MPEVQLVTASAQAMKSHEHRLTVLRSDSAEFVFRVVSRSLGQRVVFLGIGRVRNYEVDGKSPGECWVFGFEDFALVGDGHVLVFHDGPGGLQMPVEEKWVQVAWRRGFFA